MTDFLFAIPTLNESLMQLNATFIDSYDLVGVGFAYTGLIVAAIGMVIITLFLWWGSRQ